MLKSPPQTHDVFPKVEGLLLDTDVLGFSGYGGIVQAEGDQLDIDAEDPLEQPDAAANGFWWRIVLMEVINGLKTPKSFIDNVRGYRFRVRVDVNPPNESFDALHFLEGAHNRVYHALHFQRFDLDDADMAYAIVKNNELSGMFRDPQKGFRYMAAEYLTVLKPQ